MKTMSAREVENTFGLMIALGTGPVRAVPKSY